MSATSPTFRWTETYRVNIEMLDEQHQRLFNTVNELDQALRTGAGCAAVRNVLDKLVGYAGIHFAAEEALMQQYGFPGLESHRAEHERFRQALAGYLEDFRAEKSGVPVSLLFFLQEWLREHLQKTDRRYSSFLNERGVR